MLRAGLIGFVLLLAPSPVLAKEGDAGMAMPDLSQVLGDSYDVLPGGFSDGAKPGSVLRIGKSRYEEIMEGCVAAEPVRRTFTDMNMTSSLGGGVSWSGGVGGSVAAKRTIKLSFQSPERVLFQTVDFLPSAQCVDKLKALSKRQSLAGTVLVQEVLMAKISGCKTGEVSAGVRVPFFGGAKVQSADECAWVSDKPVVIGVRTVQLATLPEFAGLGGAQTDLDRAGPKPEPTSGATPAQVQAMQKHWDGCRDGAAKDCTALGRIYRHGHGVAASPVRVGALYKQGCEGGDPEGCTGLGYAFLAGRGVDKSAKKAETLFQGACDVGHSPACTELGSMYQDGNGVLQDDGRAAALLKKACDGTDPAGCSLLGDMYLDGAGVSYSEVRAAAAYKRGCDGGDLYGCTSLGRLYDIGADGIDQSDRRAQALHKKACDGGLTVGCFNLARAIEDFDHPDSWRRAAALYKSACDGGLAGGCAELGQAYLAGRGAPKSAQLAVELFKAGCDGGAPNGCTYLGFAYRDGEGVPKSMSTARRYWEMGCQGGDKWGCSALNPPEPFELNILPDIK
jgi:TPR repeat protein